MKSYTDIEQSKKLAKILPLESADMWWVALNWQETEYYAEVKQDGINQPKKAIPCWSPAALLEQLDDEIVDENGNDYTLTIVKENLQYQLYYHDSWGQAEDIETNYYDDLVDACCEMILKLNKEGLL